MSRLAALPPDAMRDNALSDRDRVVLNELGLYADMKSGWCYRAQKAIAKDTGISRRTVQRCLDHLEARGYLERQTRGGRGTDKGQQSNLYRVLFEIAGPRGQLDLFDAAAPRPTKSTYAVSKNDAPPVRHAHGVFDARVRHAHGVFDAPLNANLNANAAADAREHRDERQLDHSEPVPSGSVDRDGAIRRDPASEGAVPCEPSGEAGAVPIAAGDQSGAVPANSDIADRSRTGAVPRDREAFAALSADLRDAAGAAMNAAHPSVLSLAEPIAWIDAGCDLDLDILPTIAAIAARPRASPVCSWTYFRRAVLEARDRRRTLTPVSMASGPSPGQASSNVVIFEPKGHRHGPDDTGRPAASYDAQLAAAFAHRRRQYAGGAAGNPDDPDP